MKEFEVTIKVRNNLLIQRREELGLSSVRFAEAVGIRYEMYCSLESMRLDPIGARGWRPAVLKIAEYHGVGPDELFPPSICAVKNPTVVRQISSEQIHTFLSEYQQRAALPPDVEVEIQDERACLDRALKKLSLRERKIIALLHGLNGEMCQTAEEVAVRFGVTSARIRQLEIRALRKIRYFPRFKELQEFIALDSRNTDRTRV